MKKKLCKNIRHFTYTHTHAHKMKRPNLDCVSTKQNG